MDDRSTVESLQRLLLALSSEIQRREVEDSTEASNLGDVELSTTTTTRTTSIVVSGDQLPIEGSARRMTVSSDSPISRRVRDSRSRRRREGSRVPLGEILSDNELIWAVRIEMDFALIQHLSLCDSFLWILLFCSSEEIRLRFHV